MTSWAHSTLEAEIFECERYRPMAGWSIENLLPTDSHPYRVRGSSKNSWSTIPEAETALLAPGWDWEVTNDDTGEIEWAFEKGLPNVEGADMTLETYNVATVEEMKRKCVANADCVGFAFHPGGGVWLPKRKNTGFNADTATYSQKHSGEAWEWYYIKGRAKVAWQVVEQEEADEDGWSYAITFNSEFEGASSAGFQDSARWRRLVRRQVFQGQEALLDDAKGKKSKGASLDDWLADESDDHKGLPGCLNVDLKGVPGVSSLLLDALAAASCHCEWCLPTMADLKRQLTSDLLTSIRDNPGQGDLHQFLAGFVSSHREKKSLSKQFSKRSSIIGGISMIGETALSTVMGEETQEIDEQTLAARLEAVKQLCPDDEVEALSAVAMWKFFPEYCCPQGSKAHECRFRGACCPHAGCIVRCSVYQLPAHDVCCYHKLVTCNACDEQVRSGELKVHGEKACPMRAASCIFEPIGCATRLKHKDISSHLEDCQQAHLMLMLEALKQQQSVSHKLADRITELEERCDVQDEDRLERAAVKQEMAALDAKIDTFDHRFSDSTQCIKNEVGQLREKVEKFSGDAANGSAEDMNAAADKIRQEAAGEMEKVKSDLQASVGRCDVKQDELAALVAKLADRMESVESLLRGSNGPSQQPREQPQEEPAEAADKPSQQSPEESLPVDAEVKAADKPPQQTSEESLPVDAEVPPS